MAKPRKQTYTMYMYLKKIMDKDIRSDATFRGWQDNGIMRW